MYMGFMRMAEHVRMDDDLGQYMSLCLGLTLKFLKILTNRSNHSPGPWRPN